jgi:gamma-glutamylputrescine oxidase
MQQHSIQRLMERSHYIYRLNGFYMADNYTFSFWEKESFLPLQDYIIIGAGIVGLQAAIGLRLKHPDSRIMILERGALPSGASTRNAGFACFGSISEILDDLQKSSESLVEETVKMRHKGLSLLRKSVPDCEMNYENSGGYEIFQSGDDLKKFVDAIPDLNAKMESWIGLKNVYHHDESLAEKNGLRDVYGTIVNQYEGLLHPGKMIYYLLQKCSALNIRIMFGTNVLHIEEQSNKCEIELSGGKISALKVLVATNGFAQRLLPELEVKPARNQVLMTSPIKNLMIKGGYHLDAGYFYFRPVGNRVLIGGGRHLAGNEENTDAFGQTEFIHNTLLNLLHTHVLPGQNFEIEHSWSGILGIGSQKKPIIQMTSPSIGVAVRMGGMGVAIGTLVGIQAAEMISLC